MLIGTEENFRKDAFPKLFKESQKFKNRVLEILDEEIIRKFDKREVSASTFYDEEIRGPETDPEITKAGA